MKTHNKKKHRIKRTVKRMTFNKNQYNNADGFLTSTWGPPLWHFLHTMSFNYPVQPTREVRKKYRNFILSLQNVLPCKHCRENLVKNFKELPLTMKSMQSRETFSKYVYELHELVNNMLNKSSNLTYCEVRDRYEHFRSRCTDEEPQNEEANKLIKERGCTESMYGKKSRCILKIIPSTSKAKTLQIDKKCMSTKY